MEKFVELHKELLKEEHQAEIEECSSLKKSLTLSELQNRGICLKKLHIVSMKTGLYGRTIIKLGLRGGKDRPLPSHNFSSGDIVDLHSKHVDHLSKPELQGVVTSVRDDTIHVALDGDGSRSKADELNSNDQSLLVFKTANEVTYRRLQKGLERLLHHGKIVSSLINVCFETAEPTTYSCPAKVDKYYNDALNTSQKSAIEFALSQRELAVIHGPPGTGKTTTIAELITQFVINEQKVLACAPSNVAIDNILEKLSKVKINKGKLGSTTLAPIKVIRLGHPARILSSDLHRLSLDAMIAKSDAARIVQDVRKDLDNLYLNFRKKHNKQEQFKFREEKKILMKELRAREKKAITEILSTADVILATNVGAHADGPLKHLPNDHFDVVVIDECGQALEASCWIPLLQAPKAILAGDHLQLPPTVKSKSAATKQLSQSLLERIVIKHSKVVQMLNVQYRMNSEIMNWSSDNMYNSKLTAHDSVKDHLLKELTGVDDTEDTITPLLFIDTAGCNMPELQTIDSESIGNPAEADIVANHVRKLITAGMSPADIAVISPYNMQVDLLRKLLHQEYKAIEIRSIDGFQGREKEAVVLSLVRSNPKGVVGFLSDDRRMNVAVTRARRHLALICDSLTVGKHNFLKTLVDYMSEKGEVRSAHEFTQDLDDDESHFDASAFVNNVVRKKHSKPVSTQKQEEKHDLEKIKSGFRKTILDFSTSQEALDGKSYEFSPTLKAHERLAVHEVCEELGLKHESIGIDKDRRIVISLAKENASENRILEIDVSPTTVESESLNEKVTSNKSVNQNKDVVENRKDEKPPGNTLLQVQQPEPVIKLEEVEITTCKICGKKLPSENIKLHEIHCERLKAMKDKFQSNKQQNPKCSQKSHNSKIKKNKNKNKPQMSDDNLLNEAIRSNKICAGNSCEQSTTLLGQVCPFCKKTFCLQHHMPEVHGCGSAAHSSARRQISRDGVLYNGSGVPSKKLPPDKHANLQRKLGSKLKEMEDKRKAVNKKK